MARQIALITTIHTAADKKTRRLTPRVDYTVSRNEKAMSRELIT